ncbi:MAG: hypothetical protein VW644_01835 [Alphaproteobacteria bacterium]|jgi:hypothetical protein
MRLFAISISLLGMAPAFHAAGDCHEHGSDRAPGTHCVSTAQSALTEAATAPGLALRHRLSIETLQRPDDAPPERLKRPPRAA